MYIRNEIKNNIGIVLMPVSKLNISSLKHYVLLIVQNVDEE